MLPIPELELPNSPEPEALIRFKFRRLLPKNGKGSRKAWRKQSATVRFDLLSKLRAYSRMTVKQFRSSAGVELRTRNYRSLEPPPSLSPDVADQRWQYIKLSDRVRVIGILDDNWFLVRAFDFDHNFK
jgi:hypothetical protein